MSNKTVLQKGHAKAEKMIRLHMLAAAEHFAKRALYEAVSAWDEDADSDDLTGNTRTGFCAAVYYDGKLQGRPITVWDAELAVGRPTHGFTKPGDSGFADYGDGGYIGRPGNPAVREYSEASGLEFQKTPQGGYGYKVTGDWLRSHRPSSSRGLVITVANAVPYATYLKEARKLDILESTATSGFVKYNLINSFLDVSFADYQKM